MTFSDLLNGKTLHRLLLATADDDLREVAHIMLEKPLVVLLDARDGAAALRLARESTPDLLLLDAALPGLDLATILTALAEDPDSAGTPVLVFLPPERADDPAAATAVARMVVPFDPPELEKIVEALLRDGESRETPSEVM